MAKANSTEVQPVSSVQAIADDFINVHNVLSQLLAMALRELPNNTDCDRTQALLLSADRYNDDLYSVWERLNQIAERKAEAA